VAPLTEISTPPTVLKAKALRSLGNLPPFSPILNKLMAMLAGDNVNFAKLGDLIEKDTVVAGNLLHLVNSALYARRGTVNSVRHALSLLGIEKVRNAVLGMSLTRMWNKVSVPHSFSMAGFDMHSAAVAILSDLLAQRLPVDYPEGAFVAGLLHDLGRLLIAMSLPERYEILTLDSELDVLGFTHAELSAEALAIWNLPQAIQTAVRYHHAPEAFNTSRIPLSAIVAAANNYVNASGVSISPDGDPASSNPRMIGSLGLDGDKLEAVLAEFRTEYDVMTRFFSH
jgi:putative nucleotidyltransferase with HDIG domain